MTSQTDEFVHSQVVLHLLSLIAASERTIQEAREMGHDFIVKQYEHLRKKDIQKLNKILKENGLQVLVIEEEKLKLLEKAA
jgi:indole-3-glycerol phosphate synthase